MLRYRIAPTLLVFVSLLCLAQSQFPDTAAAHQSKAWLESFNRGDTNAHREFLEKSAPSRLEHLDREMEFRRRTGGFDVKRIEESTATKIMVLVQERSSDEFARLTMEVQAGERKSTSRRKLGQTILPAR